MAVLGISGLFTTELDDYDPTTFYKYSHDATACLVDDGKTIAAVEEERLNRDKHCFRFPVEAIKACLQIAGLKAIDVTRVAYYFEEGYVDAGLAEIAAHDPHMTAKKPREQLHHRLYEITGHEFADEALTFVRHHDTHAASAFYDSGLRESLIVVSDGNAERDGVSVFHGDENGISLLRTYDRQHSLGHFYTAITRLIGYRNFDEYKVMGLASFGNAATYRSLFDDMYTMGLDGTYSLLHEAAMSTLLKSGFRPRRAADVITQAHKDLAAGAQEVLERITLHIVSYWLKQTGSKNLCMAGGVAQNTSLNGKLLSFRGLDTIFIPPAAHDGGAALGAAMLAEQEVSPRRSQRSSRRYSDTVYLGCSVGTAEDIESTLRKWGNYVTFEEVADSAAAAADCLAADEVVAWVHDRAEFGPRALGNRSILADPRPASNRDRVNRLIKKREDYRPFAPVVTAEDAERYFDLSSVSADHSFMGFVVPVRDKYREHLGATTHIDGTARVQILQQAANPRYWKLLKEFEKRTGTPVLLNTSFNNSSEPIVQSAEDAIATFVTTGLDRLFIGPYRVTRKDHIEKALLTARVEMMPFCSLSRRTRRLGTVVGVLRDAFPNQIYPISDETAQLIENHSSAGELSLDSEDKDRVCKEVWSLWDRRLIRIIPI
ncbi:carbamoyltransferase family protein [Nocardia abscessus]|uniref:carbamoyltransferase family protein n=1 Tax=Nocardia abscessus TaxID=120957 RepID=UPI0002F0ED8D|nr:carbamoyltransferase C-terminal domain-containing protein [Nocardia abscessus]MCC3326465.1 nodulation protein [Nocardia abscessus]